MRNMFATEENKIFKRKKDVFPQEFPILKVYTLNSPSLVSNVVNNTNFRFNDSIKDAFIWTNNKNDI
jgi:hypothetical protein